MTFLKKLWLPFVLVPFAAYACSHGPRHPGSERLDAKVAAEEPVEMGGPLAAKSYQMISESKDLTQAQKDKLLSLHARMQEEVAANRREMGKLKMTLFRSLMNHDSDPREFSRIKSRILKLDRAKTDKMMSALEEAQKILGRRSQEDERYYRALMMEHIGTLDNP